jgi:hypothetical protein
MDRAAVFPFSEEWDNASDWGRPVSEGWDSLKTQ